MKYKTKIKIGISLLIALLFIIPAGSIMAERPEADEKTRGKVIHEPQFLRTDQDMYSQQSCPIIVGDVFDPEFGILEGDIPEGTYDLWTTLAIPADCGPGAVKVFLEVYRKCCGGDYGEEIIMYETSFEDNFDIYNNWIQVDQDCGMTPDGQVGFFDTWTHSDARASDGDYSFKCTMYDIYKGNQDDILMCTKSFDISEQTAINVSYDIFVDGSGTTGQQDYPFYLPYDYLSFEFSDPAKAAVDDWTNPSYFFGNSFAMENPPAAFHRDYMIFKYTDQTWMEGTYHFFDTRMGPYNQYWNRDYTPKVKVIGGGWWHVWWQIDVQELEDAGYDTTDIYFRFTWHSDPENQFEGAYVDNFKIVSLEGCEEKVFQTHTQGPQYFIPEELEEHTMWIDFPLDWDGVDLGLCKKTCYDFKLWMEVVEGDYITDFDWPGKDIEVCVGDFYDCGILDVEVETSFGGEDVLNPGPGIVTEGEDLHVTAWVHLQGTVPAYDVPVQFTAFKKEWVTEFFEDFESGGAGWGSGAWVGPDLWHVTQNDAWSGSSSLGCFDEDTNYYVNNMYGDMIEYPMTFDVRDYLELEHFYTSKWILETGYDYWHDCMFGQNYLLESFWDEKTGFEPMWRGPEQPMGEYQNRDLIADYWFWENTYHIFHDPDGTQTYEFSTGFVFMNADSSVNENSQAEVYVNEFGELDPMYWSGIFIDDVGVRGLKIGEQVYSDVIIIPEMEPCEPYEVQFEWEDVPYSNYLLRVECEPEGGCGNWPEKVPWEDQILVVSNKENLHPKEVESIDYTSFGEGEWVISSSDTDNYIATNSGVLYGYGMDQCLFLAPGNEGDCGTDPGDAACIDISAQIAAGVDVELDFDAWWDLEGWPDDYVDIYIAPGCPADLSTDWVWIESFDGYCLPETSYTLTGIGEEASDGWINMATDIGAGFACEDWPFSISDWCIAEGVTEFALKFRFVSDPYADNYRGFKMDDIVITNLLIEGFPPEFEDFVDPCDDLDDWCQAPSNTGQYWFHKFDRTSNPDHIGTYCNFYDVDGDGEYDVDVDAFVPSMNDGLIWTTEIEDCYAAYLALEINYAFDYDSYGYIEIDDGSGSWWILDFFDGDDIGGTPSGWIAKQYDISFLAGNPVQIRFRVVTSPTYVDWQLMGLWQDYFCVRNVHITGKQDHVAPTSSITMTGTMKDSGWYNTAVQVKITAEDDVAMGEIHYILDGVETVVAGTTAQFTVSGNGQHTLEFWAVDKLGNEEAHHIVPPFRIDSGSAPSVAITAPEPGLYLFGNKILSASKVIIIGAFTIEATASDAESGVYKVQFYLDGDVIAEDTEIPYSAYCAVKHMGEGTIKVVAEDFAQNTAEDTLDITYYKFL
jgi:hypothetical protein